MFDQSTIEKKSCLGGLVEKKWADFITVPADCSGRKTSLHHIDTFIGPVLLFLPL